MSLPNPEGRKKPHSKPGDDSALRRKELLYFAHDLRNLLSPVLGSAELILESGEASPRQRVHLETISRQLDRIMRLIEDTLWLGHESASQHPVNVSSLVREAAERVRTDSKAQVRCLFLTRDEGYVAGSESRLWRALYNLVLNSAEVAGESGEVLVRVFLDESHDEIGIDIQDTGPGIPENLRARIFDPSITTKEHHSGLGLALTKAIIEQHRGTISVHSEEGKGTLISIRLPLLSK